MWQNVKVNRDGTDTSLIAKQRIKLWYVSIVKIMKIGEKEWLIWNVEDGHLVKGDACNALYFQGSLGRVISLSVKFVPWFLSVFPQTENLKFQTEIRW